MELDGARMLVCGGGRRLGRAIAEDLGQAGCHVAISSRGQSTPVTVQPGRQSAALVADLADPHQAHSLVVAAADALAGLDGIVYAAGGAFTPTPLNEVTPALVEEALGSIVRGLLFVAQSAQAVLSDGGSLVVIGDVAAVRGWPSYLPHSAAKGAQRTLVSGLARSLAPRHRINLIHPGTVLPPEGSDAASLARITDRIPLGRIGTPADITSAVRYLLSADFVTGTELVVDGGRLVD
ncbi:MAG: SDR family oxidoreductase [Thermoleophilia bacterium]|nr:SDR family oxidoreductase [Thermoleophilia bacterium]